MAFECFEEMARHPRPDTKNHVFYASLFLGVQICCFYLRFGPVRLAKLGGCENPRISRPLEPPKVPLVDDLGQKWLKSS